MFIVLGGQEAIVMKKDATKKSKRIKITIVIAIVLLFFCIAYFCSELQLSELQGEYSFKISSNRRQIVLQLH